MASGEKSSISKPEPTYEASEYNIPAMSDSDSGSSDNDGAWAFETQHAVLKNNPDYINLMRTLTILYAQQAQTIKDVETLCQIKEKALEDPLSFVQRLKMGEDVGFPTPIKVAEVPAIDWERYKTGSIRFPRPRSPFVDDFFQDQSADMTRIKMEDSDDETRPGTHNQPWSVEEQARLDQLLVEFPPEEVDSNRYKKIAAALGNRTARQVTSRVQKYFVKLQQSGFLVPGRAPRSHPSAGRRRHRHRHQRNNHFLSRRSSFFPVRSEHDPGNCNYLDEVNEALPTETKAEGAEEEEEENADGDGDQEEKESDESEDDPTMNIGQKLEQMNATRLLDLLKRVIQERKRGKTDFRHNGFTCDVCKEEPIIGTRWHCKTCTRVSVDFCSECVVTQAESPSPHPLGHDLQPISSLADLTLSNNQDLARRVFQQRRRRHHYEDTDFAD